MNLTKTYKVELDDGKVKYFSSLGEAEDFATKIKDGLKEQDTLKLKKLFDNMCYAQSRISIGHEATKFATSIYMDNKKNGSLSLILDNYCSRLDLSAYPDLRNHVRAINKKYLKRHMDIVNKDLKKYKTQYYNAVSEYNNFKKFYNEKYGKD